ncbi:hypothetical protein [uncultured Thiohalocapsa sp.]|uniref:DUF7713 domain-containing protein n=1 Tax=uncultured Thiohalocapsa sp. TaxID=768990 RepID=UPI0025DC5B7E|nr:hypothetical protein [uncultured Thiohalocapsa sp.]
MVRNLAKPAVLMHQGAYPTAAVAVSGAGSLPIRSHDHSLGLPLRPCFLLLPPRRGRACVSDADLIRGEISIDPNAFARMPLLIIDGKLVSWEALGRMVSPYEGFRFKLEIFDSIG